MAQPTRDTLIGRDQLSSEATPICASWETGPPCPFLPTSLQTPLVGSGGAQGPGPRKTGHKSQLCPLPPNHSPLLNVSFFHLQNRKCPHHGLFQESNLEMWVKTPELSPTHSTSSIHGIQCLKTVPRVAQVTAQGFQAGHLALRTPVVLNSCLSRPLARLRGHYRLTSSRNRSI